MNGRPAPGASTPLCELELAPPVWLGPDVTIGAVARAMSETGSSAVMVGVGPAIVTEHDIVRAVAAGHAPDAPARADATANALCIERTASALDALGAMLRVGVRHLVVTDAGGKPCGVVSLRTAAQAVFRQAQGPAWLAGLRVALRVEV
jgi:signal-transduction protein with cAMP-binding, CBS, and nucleotidyltransferase domain